MPDLSFLAEPDSVLDWRRVVLTGVAIENGLLQALPATEPDLAARCGLAPHSVRVLLEALSVWDVVVQCDRLWQPGENFPADDSTLALRQHASFLSRWSSELAARMSEPRVGSTGTRSAAATAAWLGALGVQARRTASDIVDRCLAHVPGAARVLDVAGGHGEYGIEAARRGCSVTMIDLPSVIDIVGDWPRLREHGIRLVAGDIFDGATLDETFDLVLCFGFSHTGPADSLAPLFARLAALTNPGGGLAVSTFLRGDGPIASLFAVQMLIAGNGGDAHRLVDYESAMTAAGFDVPTITGRSGRSLLLTTLRASPTNARVS